MTIEPRRPVGYGARVTATLSLPRNLLPIALLLADDPHPTDGLDPGLVRRLDAAGVFTGGRMSSAARGVLDAVAAATSLIGVDVVTRHRADTMTVWVGETAGVWSRDGDGGTTGTEVTLATVGPLEIPLLLIQLTGFGSRPDPSEPTPIVMADLDYESLCDWVPIDVDAARRIARKSVDGDTCPDAFVGALATMRREWTVTTSWLEVSGAPHSATLRVLDGGDSGYWRIERPESGLVTVAPLDTASVNRLLHAAVPDHRPRMAG